jgi:hypothetical protein
LFSRLLCESRGLKHTKYNVVSSFVCVWRSVCSI